MTLPVFICIGAQKAGTTWIHDALRLNRALYLPEKRKEIHFFDHYFEKGLEWYEAFFANAAGRIPGEVTPVYLFDERVPLRIRAVCPNAKLIVSLRNPIERALSQYRYLQAKLGENRTFGAVIQANPELVQRGLYNAQLQRYLQWFPREQIKVLLFDDLVEAPRQVYSDICDFLGVEVGDEIAHLPTESNKSAAMPETLAARTLNLGAHYLRKAKLDHVVDACRPLLAPLARLGRSRKKKRPAVLDTETMRQLGGLFREDVAALDQNFGLDAQKRWGFSAPGGEP